MPTVRARPTRQPPDPDIIVYRISGALFFGAASSIAALLEQVSSQYRALVLDFTDVPFADATGVNMIAGVCRTAARNGARVFLTGAADDLRDAMMAHAVAPPAVQFAADVEEAVAVLKRPD